ncbi:MAG: PA14 domain-containing protein, partial [Pirellulaceae bacterium]
DRTLAVGGKDHNVVLWDMETGKRLQNIQAHSESIFGIAFSDDGNRLATLSVDGVLHVWDAATCSEIEDDPKTVDLLFATGNSHWRQKRFAEGEKTTALALELNRKSGHLSENEAADRVRYTRSMMKTLGYWPRLKEETGNWPSFTKQPPKTFATKLGEDVNLSAEVTVGDWSYQWFYNGEPIDGANSPSLELENVSKAELGIYRLEVLGEDLKPLYQKKCFATIFLVHEREKVMKGHLLREVFLDIRVGTLKVLEATSRFQNSQPDLTGVVDCWETPTNFSHLYGQRVSGFVVPPKTGDYVFYLASDDESELFLSSDESEENYQRIARVKQEMKEDATSVGYTQPRAWGDHPNSVSEPIHLEAGKRYAIKGIMADGIQGDHFAVTWQMPGDEPPKPGDPPIPGEYLEFEVK